MLQISVPMGPEGWDDEKEEFIEPKTKELQLEHSLISISKWESKWHKAFLTKNDKTEEELLDYIKCMTLTPNIDPDIYDHLTESNIRSIKDYIDDPMSATTVPKLPNNTSRKETVTSELIYYWMVALNIPQEYQKWHLNRLLKLIEVCNFKNTPHKPRSQSEIMRSNAALNKARKKKFGSRG